MVPSTMNIPLSLELRFLGDALEWRHENEPRWPHWLTLHQSFVRQRLGQVLEDMDSPDRDLIQAGLAHLSSVQQPRILRSPWILDRLARRGGAFSDPIQLSRAVLAEIDPVAASQSLEGPLTTALGDATFENGHRLYDATHLAASTGFPVDTGSDYRFPYMQGCGNAMEPYGASDSELVCKRLRKALDELDTGLPECSAIVRGFTWVLVLRRETEEQDRFRSGTFDRYVGLVLLRNAHLDVATVPRLQDALVHESIHNLLFVCEAVTEPFWDDLGATERRITSPWTGASIALPSFLHACFVWYGLYHLWSRMLERQTLRAAAWEREAMDLRTRARAGFLKGRLDAVFEPNLDVLNSDVVDTIVQRQDRITAEADREATAGLLETRSSEGPHQRVTSSLTT